LFDRLAIERNHDGAYRVGRGVVVYSNESPAQLSRAVDGADRVRELVRGAMNVVKIDWRESTALVMRRGPYVIGGGLERAAHRDQPFALRGKFLSLFEPGLPIVTNPTIGAGERALYIDLRRTRAVGVVAAACRVLQEAIGDRQVTLLTDGIESSNGIVCVRLPREPKSVLIDEQRMSASDYDYSGGVLRVRYVNHVKPTRIVINR
jgi:hypothetical protein